MLDVIADVRGCDAGTAVVVPGTTTLPDQGILGRAKRLHRARPGRLDLEQICDAGAGAFEASYFERRKNLADDTLRMANRGHKLRLANVEAHWPAAAASNAAIETN